MITLLGCNGESNDLQRGMQLREKMLNNSCSFVAEITADYGDKSYTFSAGCTAHPMGNLNFVVLSPESIGGITGKITAESGFLTFDDAVLAFPLLADGEVSPVSAPWMLVKTLRSGYLAAAGKDGEYLQLTIYDSYEEDAMQVDIWLDETDTPIRAEILYDGRRILTLIIKNFTIV
jgi:hypothetical protein